MPRKSVNRRTFVAESSYLMSGWMLASRRNCLADLDQERGRRLLTLGINALARAPERNYFADGHRGASMISAQLMAIENGFPEPAIQRIVELFNRNWATTPLCRSFPENDSVPDAVKRVGEAFADQRGVLREVGHDAIFAMHAIKVFEQYPSLATPERVDGICRLIHSFKPWRDVEPDDAVDPPPFSDGQAASRFVLQEASNAIDRFVGFGQGFAGHMLTFGQALIEMAAMGGEEWAESGRIAFRKYVTVTRQGPQPDDRRIKDHPKTDLRPDQTRYWQKRGDKTLGLGHVFKYPYAYYNLVGRAKAPDLTREFEAKAWNLF